MELGMIGLGKMGGYMTERLVKGWTPGGGIRPGCRDRATHYGGKRARRELTRSISSSHY